MGSPVTMARAITQCVSETTIEYVGRIVPCTINIAWTDDGATVYHSVARPEYGTRNIACTINSVVSRDDGSQYVPCTVKH